MKRIYKYGLAVIGSNKLLLCRPFAFNDLILPGGTKEGEENYINNLLRETQEELGMQAELVVSSLTYLGNFEDIAAGREDTIVEIELYKGEVRGNMTASSEIAELIWFDPKDDKDQLSAIIKNKILPFLISEQILTP